MNAVYATDDIIVEADMEIMNIKQPVSQSAFQDRQALWSKTLHCKPIYNE